MEINFTPDQEAQLVRFATRQGTHGIPRQKRRT